MTPFQFGQNNQTSAAPGTGPTTTVQQPITVQPMQPSQPVQQPAVGGGVFSGVGQARPPMQANYCGVGTYLAQINKAFIRPNRKRELGAIVEMKICHVLDDGQGRGHRVGDEVSWYMKVSSEYFLGEARMFVANSIGADFNEIDEDTCNRVFSDENPLGGCFVEWKGTEVATKAGGVFTKIKFARNVPAAEIKASMDPVAVNHLFPNGALDVLVEAEKPKPQS